MNAISPILFFALGIVLNIIFIYLSYLIAARKQCSHGSMLKAAAVVAAAAAVVAGLSWWLSEYIPAGCDIITAVLLIYHCGRTMLKLELRKSIAAAATYFGLILLVGIVGALLLVACLPAQG